MQELRQTDAACLLITGFEGFGDLVFHTPTIRMLSRLYRQVDVWTIQDEPFRNNPHIHELRKLPFDIKHFDVPQGVYARVLPTWGPLTAHSCVHTIDLVSLNVLGCVLRPRDKDLELFWTDADEAYVDSLLTGLDGPILVVSPARTWPSRSFPLNWWKALIENVARLGSVVLVGKQTAYESAIDMPRELWPAEEFPEARSLYNCLSLAQLACLYSRAAIAINMETASNPVSACNDRCWNVYIPTLTAPEFRVPFRHGRQDWKTRVVGNADDYYPGSLYGQVQDLKNAEVKRPSVDAVVGACRDALRQEHTLG